MKKIYENAIIETIVIDSQDVIRTSPEDTVVDMPDFGEGFEN